MKRPVRCEQKKNRQTITKLVTESLHRKLSSRKGVSGNPTGRPKKARDLDAAVLRETNSLITINENGRKMRISKHEVVVKMMINNAMKGKHADMRIYFAQYPQALEKLALMTAQQKFENGGLKDPKRMTDAELERLLLDFIENEEKEKKEKK